MSMGTELEGIIARAQLSGLSVGLLEATFAVDVVEDIRHLRPLVLERPDLPATQDALESLGLLEQESQPANGERGTLARGEQV